MNYLQFNFKVKPAIPGTDILISDLADAGFESFEETPEGCKAWIPASDYDESVFETMPVWKNPEVSIGFETEMIAPRNWNAEWESSFEPVITHNCIIRAPFHTITGAYEYEIIILPQMSFGTGHHETTTLMVEKLLTLSLKGTDVLDMGCGTGVLAILAHKRGAGRVEAIDNNAHAVENTLENITLNKAEGILVHKGEVSALEGKVFHYIFANINRNVLLNGMNQFSKSLHSKGTLLLSGFFETDIPELLECCQTYGLSEANRMIKNGWALLEMTKDAVAN